MHDIFHLPFYLPEEAVKLNSCILFFLLFYILVTFDFCISCYLALPLQRLNFLHVAVEPGLSVLDEASDLNFDIARGDEEEEALAEVRKKAEEVSM